MIPATKKELMVDQINQAILEASARLQELTVLRIELEKKKTPHLIRIK